MDWVAASDIMYLQPGEFMFYVCQRDLQSDRWPQHVTTTSRRYACHGHRLSLQIYGLPEGINLYM